MRVFALALLLAGCAPPAPPAPPPQAFLFSRDAAGPTSLAGGAVVMDPGNPCPGTEVRLVGAGLPEGQVTIDANGMAVGPVAVKPDGSFDARATIPPPAGGALVVRHGEASARFPLPACTPIPAPSSSALPTFAP